MRATRISLRSGHNDGARVMLWRGHASRRAVTLLLAAHVLCLVWLCGSWTRVRLIAFDFHEVASEAFMTVPPDALHALGYTEDDPRDLAQYGALAASLTSGAANDGERMRRLGDYIYALRRQGRPDSKDEAINVLSTVFNDMRQGDAANCSQMSLVLGAFWRGLGGHTRRLRWATSEGEAGHFAVELYSPAYARWMYYDMNLNGYFSDEDGVPLSIASVRSNLLTGENLHVVASATAHDSTLSDFRAVLARYPVEWYVLNNTMLAPEPDRRFGRFNTLYPILRSLPYPWDRIADNLLGERDRRLVVDNKIQIAGLFTFRGARLVLAYLIAQIAFCAATLMLALRPRRTRVARGELDAPSDPVCSEG